MSFLHPDIKDELPGLAMAGLNLMATLRGHSRTGARGVGMDGAPTVGAIASVITFIVRVWEESGGSKKDEKELLESLFLDPDPEKKSLKLTALEQRKVTAVIKEMTIPEKKVFRIAMFLMDPEVAIISVPEEKKGEKIIKAASTRTERTGIDPRIDVMRGIANHVKDDLNNAGEVAAMLRDVGALGSDNKALLFLSKVQTELKKLLCRALGVSNIEDITLDIVLARARVYRAMFRVPDVTDPGPPAGWFVRAGRVVHPGSYPNTRPCARVRNTEEVRKSFLSTISGKLVLALAVIALVLVAIQVSGYPITSLMSTESEPTLQERLLKEYQPAEKSASTPTN